MLVCMSAAVSRSVPDSRVVRHTLRAAAADSWSVALRSLRVLTGVAVTFLLLLFGPATAATATGQPGPQATIAQAADSRPAAGGAPAAGAAAVAEAHGTDASFPGSAAQRPADSGETAAPQRPRPATADENAESRGRPALGERAPPRR